MDLERRRKFERIIVIIRWLVLVAGILSSTGPTGGKGLFAVGAVVCAYNLPAIKICSRPQLFSALEWYTGPLLRVFDTLLISWAVFALDPAHSNLYVLYLFVIVSASVVYGWRIGLLSAMSVSILYSVLIWHAGEFARESLPMSTFIGRIGLFLFTSVCIDVLVREAERDKDSRVALRRLRGLYEISAELMNIVDIDHLLQMILDLAIEQTDADRGSLMLADPKGAELTIRAARGVPQEIIRTTRTKKGEGIAGYVFSTGEAVMLGDLGSDARFKHLVRNNQIISSLSVPISARGQVIGVLNASSTGRREPFTENDLKLLSLLAGQASVAIQNSRMFAELKSLADTDGLTGLYNRRYLDQCLEAECHRAHRYRLPISIFLFDIDDFKNYNDTYGHLQGDDILRELAAVVRDNIRVSDIPARYGGEEFLVILTHTDYEGAKIAAERLRMVIEEHHFGVALNQNHRLTISGGVASTCGEEVDANEFLQRSDTALLQAKTSGKDRVFAAQMGNQQEIELVPQGLHPVAEVA